MFSRTFSDYDFRRYLEFLTPTFFIAINLFAIVFLFIIHARNSHQKQKPKQNRQLLTGFYYGISFSAKLTQQKSKEKNTSPKKHKSKKTQVRRK